MGSLWNRSNTIERYADDIRAAGAQAFFYDGGTTTPLTVFRDAGSSSAFANPVVADAHGRWPDVFVPYVTGYDVRVLTADDVQLTFSQNIPNPNPGTGGSGGGDGDPTNAVQTGMIHAEFVNAGKPGYVRLNGRTIGNASSGATERANADTSDLFVYLWNNLQDDVATVTPSRGASAVSDFAANKNILLPDMRGMTLIGLDDMGNSPGARFGSLINSAGGADYTRPGVYGGINELFPTAAQMPAHNHVGQTSTAGAHNHSVEVGGTTDFEDTGHVHDWAGTFVTGLENQSHAHGYVVPGTFALNVTGGGTGVSTGSLTTSATTGLEDTSHNHTFSVGGTTDPESANHQHTLDVFGGTDVQGLHSHVLVTSTVGGNESLNNMPYTRLITWFIKL